MIPESEYIIYVDESGDHSLAIIDPLYPIFVLVFCIFKKVDYINTVSPLFNSFKFTYFGHDLTVLHNHEIRKSKNEFSILLNENVRLNFFNSLNETMNSIPFSIITSVIDKQELKGNYPEVVNPYHLALKFCLESTFTFLQKEEQRNKRTFIVVEERGREEDAQLKTIFQEIVDGENDLGLRLPIEMRFASKKTNVIGLQIADLVAHPIGRHLLLPNQNNRSFDILKKKLWKTDTDLKIFPEKRKTPVTTEATAPTGHSQST